MFEICLFLYCDAPKYAVRTAKEFGCMLKPNASLDQSMILWLIPVVAAHVDFTSIYIKILIIIIHIYIMKSYEIINDLPDQNQYWRMWRVEPMGPIDQTCMTFKVQGYKSTAIPPGCKANPHNPEGTACPGHAVIQGSYTGTYLAPALALAGRALWLWFGRLLLFFRFLIARSTITGFLCPIRRRTRFALDVELLCIPALSTVNRCSWPFYFHLFSRLSAY